MAEDPENRCCQSQPGISRRGFLSSVGTGAVAASIGGAAPSPAQEIQTVRNGVTVSLRINGYARKVAVEPRWSLLFVLREMLGLTAVKVGCERAHGIFTQPGSACSLPPALAGPRSGEARLRRSKREM